MAQETAVEWLKTEMEQYGDSEYLVIRWTDLDELINHAKQMWKEQNDKWNEFLDAEKVLGISDVKTIERIQWYYNTYFNKKFGKQ